MAEATKTYTFTALTPAVASEVNQNFNDVLGFLNGSVVHLDGSKPMTGGLVLPDADPTSPNQAARKKYVDDRPRGRIAHLTRNTQFGVIGHQIVPGMTVSLTPQQEQGRRLQTSVYIPRIDGANSVIFYVRIRNAAGATLNRWQTLIQNTFDGQSAFLTATTTGVHSARQLTVEAVTGGTTIHGTAMQPITISVDDLGPA